MLNCTCVQLRQERDALEVMRVDFEHELQQAQAEVAKAQDALKTAEDRVRAVEQVERQKIISGACRRGSGSGWRNAVQQTLPR